MTNQKSLKTRFIKAIETSISDLREARRYFQKGCIKANVFKNFQHDFKFVRRRLKALACAEMTNFGAKLKQSRRSFKNNIRNSALCKKYFKKFANAKIRRSMAKITIEQNKINYYTWKYPAFIRDKNEKCFIWFVPDWSNVWGGGHYTLFRFANYFANREGIKNIIYIYNDTKRRDTKTIENELRGALKNCKLKVIIDPNLLPKCDVIFATTWQSAYDVKAFSYAKVKFYFMQDYESQFYAHGTNSMQANNSYKFGFYGITGGTWLRQIFESYGMEAQSYIFSTDKDIFYSVNNGKVRDEVSKIFFYGRPSTERRCFELGIAALAEIAELYPKIEIIIAGLQMDLEVPFKATLLGNLSLKATGDLYRTCDVGIAFSGTNLSYLPVELMASGCPVLTNNGPQTEWYCNDDNAMLVDPVVAAVVDGFKKLYNSKELRQFLVNKGLEKSASTSWEKEMDKVYNFVAEKLMSHNSRSS